jgi:outer membrane protein
MKKSIYLIAVITLLFFVWSSSSLAEDKIGFVNLQEIMHSSNAGKKVTEDLEKFSEEKGQEIKSSEKDLTKMKEELEKQSSSMTQSSRNEKESAYNKKMRDYQLLVNDTNEELNRRDQEMTQKIIPEIIKIIRSIAEKEKYTLIIDVATLRLPYYDKGNDLSKKVLEEFNKNEITGP